VGGHGGYGYHRYMRCVQCRRKWNISDYQKFPEGGYVCPECSGVEEREEEEWEITKGFAGTVERLTTGKG